MEGNRRRLRRPGQPRPHRSLRPRRRPQVPRSRNPRRRQQAPRPHLQPRPRHRPRHPRRQRDQRSQVGQGVRRAMTAAPSQSAILLLAHGTPNILGEMAEYLSKITGGRALPQEVVEELQHRYAQIGLGETPGAEPPPLTKWTIAQGQLLEQALNSTRVYVAMRNWHPYIAD